MKSISEESNYGQKHHWVVEYMHGVSLLSETSNQAPYVHEGNCNRES